MNYNTWTPNFGQQPAYFPAWQAQRPDMGQGYSQGAQSAPAASQGQNPGFAVRPVTGREEAVAAQVDFFSPGVLMPDFAHGVVYFKRFNQNTGASDFMTFRLEGQQEEKRAPEYATREDLLEMRQVVEGLAADIDTLRGRGGKRIAEE